MILYHVTTAKKIRQYHASKRIMAPVRGFDTLMGAMWWAIKIGRRIILRIEGEGILLPDHHNPMGRAYWINSDILEWKREISCEEDVK
jgi:hypothetical protein